jgi:hypothetical protein
MFRRASAVDEPAVPATEPRPPSPLRPPSPVPRPRPPSPVPRPPSPVPRPPSPVPRPPPKPERAANMGLEDKELVPESPERAPKEASGFEADESPGRDESEPSEAKGLPDENALN